MASRDLTRAREAFSNGDVSASLAAHAAHKPPSAEPGHVAESGEGKVAVYAAFDGIVVAVVVLVVAVHTQTGNGALHPDSVLSVGIGCVGALGVMVTLRELIRSFSDHKHWNTERSREVWELKNHPKGEREEMIEIYEARGISSEDARTAVNTLSKKPYSEFFVDMMMFQELEIPRPQGKPLTNAMAACLGFFTFGSLPLLVYSWLIRLPWHELPVGVPFGPDTAHFQLAVATLSSLLPILGLVAMKYCVLPQRRVWYLHAPVIAAALLAGVFALLSSQVAHRIVAAVGDAFAGAHNGAGGMSGTGAEL